MHVRREARDATALVTIDRPEALNALSLEVIAEIAGHVDAISGDRSVRAVVITGAGERAFSAGADLARMHEASPPEAKAMAERGHALFAAIEALPVPVIAAINGYCLGGGCELALACDIRVASESAQIGLPEVGVGIFPGWGGTQRMPRLVGPGLAMELIATGRRIPAEEALRIGLVNRVLPPGDLLAHALDLGAQIARNAPAGVRAAKELVRLSAETGLTAGLAHERDRFALLFGTADQREGMGAFLEKRSPNFTGS